MSNEAVGHVWRFSPYTGAPMLVLLAIADVVNDQNGNQFWMSVANLCKKTRVARSTVIAALKRIEDDGWLIRVKENPGETVFYQFNFDDDRAVVFESRNPSGVKTPHPSDNRTPPVRKSDTPRPMVGPNTNITTKELNTTIHDLVKLYFDHLTTSGIKPTGKMIAGQIELALRQVSPEKLRVLVPAVAAKGMPLTPNTLMIEDKVTVDPVVAKKKKESDKLDYELWKIEVSEAKANAVPMPEEVRLSLRK